MRALVVEDEQKVANTLREGLEEERYEVMVERTGEGAFFRINTETFDVVVLDLTLPGRDGLEILKAMRRRGLETPVLVLTARDLKMNLITRQVTRGSRTVELTVREFELLEYLLRHQGHVVSRETLARDVWKETARTTPLDNVIDVHIARLCRKVDADPGPKLIHTVRGVGFMLREGKP